MHWSSRSWLSAIGLAIAFAAGQTAIAGDGGCGAEPQPSCGCQAAHSCGCYVGAACGCRHHHCRVCVFCRTPPSRDRGATRDARADDYRSAAPAVVVQSMPTFAMPMMMASVPVMPTMATRAAEPTCSGSTDSTERLNRLEQNLLNLTDRVAELRVIVEGQTRALEALAKQPKK